MIEVRERAALDEVWVIPANASPFPKEQLIAGDLRFEMVRLALEPLPWAKVLKIELERPAPSFTIDTIHELVQKNPGYTFHLLLGEDTLKNLHRWRSIHELLELTPPLVFERGKAVEPSTRTFSEGERKKILSGLVEGPTMEISSTEIRKRIKKSLYIGHLLPAKVLDFIYAQQLYF